MNDVNTSTVRQAATSWARPAIGILAILCLAVLSAVVTLRVARAYSFTGYTWSSISYLAVCDDDSWSIDTTSWDDSLTNWYNTPTPFDYYLSCQGQLYLQDVDDSGYSWDGLATYTVVSGHTIEDAAVVLNGWYTNSYSSEERDSVSGHELGHALGLDDIAGGAEVMNSQTCGSYSRFCYYTIWGPQSDDINGINALY